MKDLGIKRKDYELVEPSKTENKETVDYPTLYLRDEQVDALNLPSDAFTAEEGGKKYTAEITFEVTSMTKSKNKDGGSSSVDLKILSVGDLEPYESQPMEEEEDMGGEDSGENEEEMDNTTEKNKKLRPVNMGLLD